MNCCENFTLFSIISQLLIEIVFLSLIFCLADWHRIRNMEFSSLQMYFWHFQIEFWDFGQIEYGDFGQIEFSLKRLKSQVYLNLISNYSRTP